MLKVQREIKVITMKVGGGRDEAGPRGGGGGCFWGPGSAVPSPHEGGVAVGFVCVHHARRLIS